MNIFGGPALTREQFQSFIPQTFSSFHLLVTTPLGFYQPSSPINPSANRWMISPTVNFSYTPDQGWSWIETYVSGRIFTDNGNYLVNGAQTLTQRGDRHSGSAGRALGGMLTTKTPATGPRRPSPGPARRGVSSGTCHPTHGGVERPGRVLTAPRRATGSRRLPRVRPGKVSLRAIGQAGSRDRSDRRPGGRAPAARIPAGSTACASASA